MARDRMRDRGVRRLGPEGVKVSLCCGLAPDRDATAVRDHMLELGAITRAIGSDTLSFCPPLVIADGRPWVVGLAYPQVRPERPALG